MKISFHGAARTVTGSKHLIHLHLDKKILLDCGMFQGMGKETIELNNDFGFEPSEISMVIISHAHIDHIGLLPKLVKDGYNGPIFCTKATAALSRILLRDSANIQEADVKYANKIKAEKGHHPVAPLYTIEDVHKTVALFNVLSYEGWHQIDDQVQLMFTEMGHIIGSAAINLKLKENGKQIRLTFSGDVGRYGDPLLKSPQPFPQTDYLILESTYGDALHPLTHAPADLLLYHIEKTCMEKKGKLIIPSFSVGRTQELLYALNQLELEKRLPKLMYVVDSPLSVEATQLVKKFPDLFNDHVQKVLKKDQDPFDFEGLVLIDDVEASKALNYDDRPMVIISASGMAEAGRVKHHIANNISDSKNTILLVGYCEPQSLGGRLKKKPEHVGIFGQDFKVEAEIEEIESLSAHGDYNEISQWLACQNAQEVKKVFLVHGEYDVQETFKSKLIKKGFLDVVIPFQHEVIGIG
jgi:metallo-beta-lactamase family protein